MRLPAILIAHLFACGALLAAEQYAVNGDFSRGGDVAEGWALSGAESGTIGVVRDLSDKASGPASLRLESRGGIADGNVNQVLKDVAGKTLRLRGNIKGQPTGAGFQWASLAILVQDANWKQIGWFEVVPGGQLWDNTWKPFSSDIAIPDAAANVLLIYGMRGEGRLWLDSLSVTEAGSEPAAAAQRPTVPPVARGPGSPTVEEVYRLSPSVIGIAVQAGRVVPAAVQPYAAKPGDRIDGQKLIRDGKDFAWIYGNGLAKDMVTTFEDLAGDELQLPFADWNGSWTVTSADDQAFAAGVHPVAVARKSKPNDWELSSKRFAMLHRLYLTLPTPLTAGKTYKIACGDLNLKDPVITWRDEPQKTRSEAVHASQIGYRPEDRPKRAFVSAWLGTGGGLRYDQGLTFAVVDAGTGKPVYTGKAELGRAATDTERLSRDDHWHGADIWTLDYSAVCKPGTYRIYVDGIGTSYPVTIAEDVWTKAFVLQQQGLYNNRSGIELAPPAASWKRPRALHPADGQKTVWSTATALDDGEGGEALAKKATDRAAPEAWGGYHDAGDWNPRRVTHMKVTMAGLEIAELLPEFAAKTQLSFKRTLKAPAVVEEALFVLDCFRRLQQPDGGVGYGIETNGDPKDGEVSWKQSMTQYVWAPDCWASWTYAAVAARAARILAKTEPALAKTYQESALKAMAWAEGDRNRRVAAGKEGGIHWNARDARNLAALECWLTSGDVRWREVFLATTVLRDPGAKLFAYGDHVQIDAAFLYAIQPVAKTDPALRAAAVAGITALADAALAYQQGNVYGLTSSDPGKPLLVGYFGSPHAIELVRAHYLTGDAKYRAGAVIANQYLSGCNGMNMTFTSGLGFNPPRHPLYIDTRNSGQPAPVGLTVSGPIDPKMDWAKWVIQYFLGKAATPGWEQWPTLEAYADIHLYPSTNEFCVDWWAPNVYVWGYLAAK